MLRQTYRTRPFIAILAGLMLLVALACAGDSATPTSPPTATSPAPTATTAAPTGPAATVPAGATATATAVPQPTEPAAALTWMEGYLQGPGYNPEWGQPIKGGTFIFGAQRDSRNFLPGSQGCCYTHGCYSGLAWNGLFRINPWTGDLTTIEGDLVETWDMSDDGVTLTMKLREGVMFIDEADIAAESPMPAEFNGGKIAGDELVCEDAVATVDRYLWPPEYLKAYSSTGQARFGHLESLSCPDGPRGHTFVMHFSAPRAKTMAILSTIFVAVLDKDYVAWLNDWGDREGVPFYRNAFPDNFYAMHGTGPFVPVNMNTSVSTTFDANPNYFREGLPILDRYHNVVIKDIGTRFTALATGKIHFMGEGSWSMTPGQAQQAMRDFSDRIVINNQLNHWARTLFFGARAPWDDVRVRKAISLALDRDEWLSFYRIPGYEGMKLAHTMAPGTYYAPTEEEIRTWPGYRQPKDEDIAEANRLMDEVFGPGERPTANCLAVVTDQADIDACLFVMDNLGKNLDMEVSSDFMEAAARTDITTTGNFDFTISSYTANYSTDPDDDLATNYISSFASVSIRSSVEARWAEDPEVMAEVQAMIEAQSAELDPVKRKQLVREMDLKILNDVSQYVVVGWSLIFPGWRVELKGFRGYDLYSNTKWAMNERMWLSD